MDHLRPPGKAWLHNLLTAWLRSTALQGIWRLLQSVKAQIFGVYSQ
jgi:hypothetical protein